MKMKQEVNLVEEIREIVVSERDLSELTRSEAEVIVSKVVKLFRLENVSVSKCLGYCSKSDSQIVSRL